MKRAVIYLESSSHLAEFSTHLLETLWYLVLIYQNLSVLKRTLTVITVTVIIYKKYFKKPKKIKSKTHKIQKKYKKNGFWLGFVVFLGSVSAHFYFLFTIVMKVLISCTENPKFFIELELCIDKKVIFDEKKISVGPPSAVCRLPSVNKFCNPHNFFSFQPRHFSFSG
jgi:hypothetical protein